MPGHDQIPDELYSLLPATMAGILHPLVVKMGLLIAEPIAYKGGTMIEIYKAASAGPHDSCDSYRGVWVNSGLAKHFHRGYRQRLIELANIEAPDTQCGGFGGRGTDHAAHVARAIQEYAE